MDYKDDPAAAPGPARAAEPAPTQTHTGLQLTEDGVVNYRNAVLHPDGVSYDCEVEHATFGWLPFTATPHDAEEYGRKLNAQIHSDLAINPHQTKKRKN